MLMCRIAPAALHEATSAARHPADEKVKRLKGDPEGSTGKPMRNDRLVRRFRLTQKAATLGLRVPDTLAPFRLV